MGNRQTSGDGIAVRFDEYFQVQGQTLVNSIIFGILAGRANLVPSNKSNLGDIQLSVNYDAENNILV